MIGSKSKNIYRKWVRSFQRKLYHAAKKCETRRFGILYDKVIKEEVLNEAWRRVSRKADSSPGIDGESIKRIKEQGVQKFLEGIRKELTEESYKPAAIQRVYIPKDNKGNKRPLGIPTVKDRVIQMAVKLIIEPLFEADFKECSYGFRPKRRAHQAVKIVHQYVNTHKWVVDLDLKSYFDTIPHGKLLELVRKRVSDRKIIHLIRGWLKAGILEEGKLRNPETGSPQGGVISPLLSNIYLHEFDSRWNGTKGKLTRYADDMVIITATREQAEKALETAEEILEELGLKLNRKKTKICHVQEGFDFLGFTFKEAYSKVRKRKVRIKYPRVKNRRAIQQKIKEAVKELPLGTDLREAIRVINRKIRGWANYFRIGNAYEAAQELNHFTCEQLRIFWRRRSQNKRIRGKRKWPDRFFYEKGLYYVPKLL